VGISDRHHFDWLTGALGRFEAEQGRLAALAAEPGRHAIWCVAGQRETPPVALLRDALGRTSTDVVFLDKFATEPGVRPLDLNALEGLPDAACDVLALFRASYFIADPPRFLAHARRVLRPGGLAVIDWLHGVSDAPVLGIEGDEGYGGSSPRVTTYCDPQFPREFRGELERFLRHVNHPPAWVNVEEPGTPVPFRERVRRTLRGGARSRVPLAGYVEALREALELRGKHFIGPELMEQHFKVLFRDARYFYRHVKKFNLFLLTVLSPVGK
jgi:SAM-dependent methyltransferase